MVIDVGEPKDSAVSDLDALQEQTGLPFVHVSASIATMGDAYRKLGELLGLEDEAETLAAYCDDIYARTQSIAQSVEKANLLYDFLDNSKLFKGTAQEKYRSRMNVTFVTGDADKDAAFVKEATARGLVNLKGHRIVGGMRASIYNAMPIEGVVKLVEFMKEFEMKNA